jgi:hypothetical protein
MARLRLTEMSPCLARYADEDHERVRDSPSSAVAEYAGQAEGARAVSDGPR